MKKVAILTIILLIFLSGCKTQTNRSDEIPGPTSDETLVATLTPTVIDISAPVISPIPTLSVTPFPTILPSEAPYLAYYQKYTELEDKYGKATLVDRNSSKYDNSSYLSGVCVVDLMDFNADGVEDLFVIYSNGNLTGLNSNDIAIPQASSYEIEVWTYTKGIMKQLLHESQVSCYSSFRTEYWDNDNCFATVYENSVGSPVIQIYNESFDYSDHSSSITYTNLYYSEDALARDTLSYDGKQYIMNNAITTEKEWETHVGDYNKFIRNICLSSADYLSTGMLDYGIDYNATLRQTESVIDALSNRMPVEFSMVEQKYLSLYLQELGHYNQISSDVNYYNNPYEYCLNDIDQNGTPELIVITGGCEADFMYQIYSIVNDKLLYLGKISAFHSCLYTNNAGGLVNYQGQMGCYTITKITVNQDKLVTDTIAEGEVSGDQDYPELEEYDLGDYDESLSFLHVTVPYLLYAYEVRE